MTALITVKIGKASFHARLRDDLAPRTCERFRALLPLVQRMAHVRWSGEACWIPLGNFDLGVGLENATSHPAPGDFIFYPAGVSEAEILLAYGGVRFASKAGQLAGSPFLTLVSNLETLHGVGHNMMWSGAQEVRFG